MGVLVSIERYFVIPVGDGWVVMNNGRVSGLFSTRDTAAAFAKVRAQREAEARSGSYTIQFEAAVPA